MEKQMKKIRLLVGSCGITVAVYLAVNTLLPIEFLAATAGEGVKKRASAFGGVNSLAVDVSGRALFIASQKGVFRSDDGGTSWHNVRLALKQAGVEVTAVAPDPKNSKTIYVATREAGVWKSQDGGVVWQQINKGLRSLEIHGLAVDVTSSNRLYAASRETRDAIYKSTDGGEKWSRVDMGPDGDIKSVTSVNISSGAGGIFLYAGTSAGLQRSPDCF